MLSLFLADSDHTTRRLTTTTRSRFTFLSLSLSFCLSIEHRRISKALIALRLNREKGIFSGKGSFHELKRRIKGSFSRLPLLLLLLLLLLLFKEDFALLLRRRVFLLRVQRAVEREFERLAERDDERVWWTFQEAKIGRNGRQCLPKRERVKTKRRRYAGRRCRCCWRRRGEAGGGRRRRRRRRRSSFFRGGR